MEKISIQSSYTQLSLYAKATLTTGGTPKPQDGQAVPAIKPDDGGAGGDGSALVARNQDGDTFTLSIEARAIQISRKITIETTNDGEGCGKPSESDRLSSHGQVNSLMDALDMSTGHTHKHQKRHHGHFPQLGDADDLAARLREHWDKEHAEKGGAREDFAEAIRKRLDAWKSKGESSANGRTTVSYEEFRTEVSIRISASLTAWAGDNSPAGTGGDVTATDPAGSVPADSDNQD